MKLNIVLYNPEIPQNTGNIFRTCVGTNAKLHLIEPLGFSLNEKYLRRSALDYYDYIDYQVYEDFDDFLANNQGKMYFLTRYGKRAHTAINFPKDEDIYLIFGKESTGIPYELLKANLDSCYRIPMSDKIRSLNLANCVAITIYEVLRQLDYPDMSLEEPFKGKDFLD